MQIEKIFGILGLSASSAQLVTFVLVILAFAVVFWLLVGRKRLHAVLMNIYLAFVLTEAFPKDVIGTNVNVIVATFLAVILILTFFSKHTFDIQLSGSGLAYWQLFVMSLLEVGLIASISAFLVGDKVLLKFLSKDALFYLTSPWAKFAWFAMPLAFLVYINKKG